MPKLVVPLFFFFCCQLLFSQDLSNLDFFLESVKANSPVLRENENKKQIGEIQDDIIRAQNNAFQVNATSEVLFAPYFNNNGRIIEVTTTPSSTAYGYDVGITNGGLYTAQINVTKNLFNQAVVDNLLFQSKINNEAISLSSKEIEHNLIKNITDAYVMAYQLQLQEDFTRDILKDLSKRLEVLELLVKRGILQESDYLLLQLDTESKNLELQQIENNLQVTINQLYTFSGMTAQPMEKLSEPVITKNNLSEETNRFYEQRFVNDSLQIMADQRVFENAYKPQLTAYGNTGLNAVEIPNIEHRLGLSAGLRLTIPIYDGKQRQYNTQQSKLREESLTYYKDNAEIQLKNNLLSINEQIIALQENKMLLDKQIEKQVNILEIYKGKLVQGQVSIVDYLNVIQNYKQSIYTQLQMQTNLWLLQSQYNFINW
jgi:outer membrane protein TolC